MNDYFVKITSFKIDAGLPCWNAIIFVSLRSDNTAELKGIRLRLQWNGIPIQESLTDAWGDVIFTVENIQYPELLAIDDYVIHLHIQAFQSNVSCERSYSLVEIAPQLKPQWFYSKHFYWMGIKLDSAHLLGQKHNRSNRGLIEQGIFRIDTGGKEVKLSLVEQTPTIQNRTRKRLL